MVEWTSIKVSEPQRTRLNTIKDNLDKKSIGAVSMHHVIDFLINSSSIEPISDLI